MAAAVAGSATFRLSSVAEMREHAGALFREHYDEIARNKAVMVLSPDWPKYEAMEQAGLLLALSAWIGDELVGYSVGFITAHLHYSELRYYQNDVLFVARPHRASRLGLRLIAETEERAAAQGARLVVWHAKQGTALDALLPRLGYGVQDIIYSREVW